MPGNGEEAAYVAFAITEELINLLIAKGRAHHSADVHIGC
jgi:hypothetical protein